MQKKPPPSDSNKMKDLFFHFGLTNLLKMLNDLLNVTTAVTKYIFKHTKFKQFQLEIIVAQEDAAQTAIRYGQICSIVYPALNLIFSGHLIKTCSVNISPDFNKTKPEIDFRATFKIRLIYVINCVFFSLIRFVKKLISIKLESRKV